jgi:Ca2+:H+ antiporter
LLCVELSNARGVRDGLHDEVWIRQDVTWEVVAMPTRHGLTKQDFRLVGGCALLTILAGAFFYAKVGEVATFVAAAIALAALATLVGHSVDALGDQLGAGALGVIQSALGNLPELFVTLFALHAGLYDVVRAAIVGSILANVLLVLGLAFLVGGLRNGTQRFATESANRISLMLVLAVAALLVPALTAHLHTAAAGHERALSIIVSIVLLVLFAASLPAAMRQQSIDEGAGNEGRWTLPVAIGMLSAAGVGAAFVSDWFVDALAPAMSSLGISQAFAGLVIVAIAGNAVENVVGIQLAARNKSDVALSVILQSPLQIALVLAPVAVLAAPLVGATFTLVLSPLLVAVLAISVIVTVFVVLDGESNWFEGLTLVALYALIATAFWWG